MKDEQVREQVSRVEALLGELESRQSSAGGVTGLQAVQALVDLYGEALARVMERTQRWSPDLARELAGDELLAHLLLVHGLHPLDVRGRVDAALDRLRAEGAEVELLAVEDATVTLRVSTGGGCGSAGRPTGTVIEEVVRMAAPEIEHVQVDGVTAAATTFIPLSTLTVR